MPLRLVFFPRTLWGFDLVAVAKNAIVIDYKSIVADIEAHQTSVDGVIGILDGLRARACGSLGDREVSRRDRRGNRCHVTKMPERSSKQSLCRTHALQIAFFADRRLRRVCYSELARLDATHRVIEMPARLLDALGS